MLVTTDLASYWPDRVYAPIHCPLFHKDDSAWAPVAGTYLPG